MTDLSKLENIKEFKDLIKKTKATFTTEDFYHLEKNRYVFLIPSGTFIVYLDRHKNHFDFIFIQGVKPNSTRHRR